MGKCVFSSGDAASGASRGMGVIGSAVSLTEDKTMRKTLEYNGFDSSWTMVSRVCASHG